VVSGNRKSPFWDVEKEGVEREKMRQNIEPCLPELQPVFCGSALFSVIKWFLANT
jgi:hypothetical protein